MCETSGRVPAQRVLQATCCTDTWRNGHNAQGDSPWQKMATLGKKKGNVSMRTGTGSAVTPSLICA
eukprot:12242-Heterococcus_DN1.PRE.2